jgi:hypothetical protein
VPGQDLPDGRMTGRVPGRGLTTAGQPPAEGSD